MKKRRKKYQSRKRRVSRRVKRRVRVSKAYVAAAALALAAAIAIVSHYKSGPFVLPEYTVAKKTVLVASKPKAAVLVKPEPKPAAVSAQKPAEKPAEKPASKPLPEPVQKTAQKPVQKPAQKPAQKPEIKPQAKPKPEVKPKPKPEAKPAPKAAPNPIFNIFAKHPAKPAAKPVPKPPKPVQVAKKKTAAPAVKKKEASAVKDKPLTSSIKQIFQPKRRYAKVAIVLDDFGYSTHNIGLINSIDAPLTLAVLPNLPYTRTVADKMHSFRNREIILHMPMEPEGSSVDLEKNTILVSMKREEIAGTLEDALRSVPYAKGMNNHMGSKATANERVIGTVMADLRNRDLYYLDSASTPNSVCCGEAKDAGIRFLRRNVFLDNIADKVYISKQLDELVKMARENRSAVGIGHDRKLTVEAIAEYIRRFKKDPKNSDVKFVLASELAKKD